MLCATTACTFSTSGRQKVVRGWCVLCILTWKCASRHTACTFGQLNFQKWSETVGFWHVWLGNVLRATRRALFRQLNFQKWSERAVLLAFVPTNALRALTACTFSTAQLPKVVRTCGAFSFCTYKCASRPNGVHFFISHVASGSAPAALARLLFDPSEPQIIGKTQWIATSLPFRAPASSLFWLSPSLTFPLLTSPLWLFPPLLFHLCILSEVWLLNFLR